jgi:mannosyltransferase
MSGYQIMEKKVLYPVFGLVLLAGIFLRFFNLGFQSLWLDELYTVVPTNPDVSISALIEYCKTDQPPLYFLLVNGFFHLFGYSEITARIASAVIGVAAIPAMFFLGREIRGNHAGFFAAAITTFSYFHIYYSQEARFYALAFLLSALSYLFFIRAFKYSKPADFAFYILCTSGLLYTHYFGMIVFGAQFITFLILLKYNRKTTFIVGSIISGILVGISFIPWLPTILYDLNLGPLWLGKPKALFLAEYFYGYTGKDAITTILYLVLIFVFFRSLAKEKDTQFKPIAVVLILWIVICYLVPFVRSHISTPMLHVRYTIVILPAWFAVMAVGLSSFARKKIIMPILAILAISSLANLFFFRKHYFKIAKTQFRESSALILSKKPGAYPVYSSVAWHYSFYFRNSDINVRSVYDEGYKNDKIFWLLEGHIFSKDEYESLLKKIAVDFEMVERHQFFDSEAILFQVKQ